VREYCIRDLVSEKSCRDSKEQRQQTYQMIVESVESSEAVQTAIDALLSDNEKDVVGE